jgi:hypothetical protein
VERYLWTISFYAYVSLDMFSHPVRYKLQAYPYVTPGEVKLLMQHGGVKVKLSHYRPVGPRGFWEFKAPRFRDIGTRRW